MRRNEEFSDRTILLYLAVDIWSEAKNFETEAYVSEAERLVREGTKFKAVAQIAPAL